MIRTFLFLSLIFALSAAHGEGLIGVDDPLHGYFTSTPADRFTRWNEEFKAGKRTLDTSGELAMLRDLLGQLEIPVSSQMLVYSVTSLQKELISPRRPRALYFNEDTYVGFVPGGRLEVISLDPNLGSIYYISDRVRPGQSPRLRRSEECMTCHAPQTLGHVPALALESVVPGITGGGERAFRRGETGHAIPLSLRFAGWHLTGTGPKFPVNWANKIIERSQGEAHEIATPIGRLFDLGNYLLPTSDVLPQLLQEHQIGFANRAIEASYRARAIEADAGQRGAEKLAAIETLSRPLVRYLLFADETAIPAGSVTGDPEYRSDFARNRRADAAGRSLKDFDLETRLFRYRCSYMIYSPAFAGLPELLKMAVFRRLKSALSDEAPAEFAYLSMPEKRAIRSILHATLSDLPNGFD